MYSVLKAYLQGRYVFPTDDEDEEGDAIDRVGGYERVKGYTSL